MKKIKVYDIDAFLKDDGFCAFRYKNAAILEGEKGVIFAEHEAVHMIENLLTDSIKLELTKIPEKGTFYILPSHELTVQISDIVNNAPYKEMTMEEFFSKRDYNPRCQNNFSILLASMKIIGLDVSEYFVKNNSLDKKIEAVKEEQSKLNKENSNNNVKNEELHR